MNTFESFLEASAESQFLSRPGHPYAFKAAYDYDTGHALKITYDITVPTFQVCQIGPVGVAMDVGKNWIQFVRNVIMGDFNLFQRDPKKWEQAIQGLDKSNVRAAKEAEATVQNVRKRGHLDFTGKGCVVLEIYDRVTKQPLTGEVRMIGPFSIKKKSPLAIPEHMIPAWHAGKLKNFEIGGKGFRVDTLQVGQQQELPTFLSTHWFPNAETELQVTPEYAKKWGYDRDDHGYAVYKGTNQRVLFDLVSTMISNVEYYDFDDGRARKTKHTDYNAMKGTIIDGKENEDLSTPGLVKQGFRVLGDAGAKPLATAQVTKFDLKHDNIIARLMKMDQTEQLRELLALKDQKPDDYLVVSHILDYMGKRRYAALHNYMNTIKPMWESADDLSGSAFFEHYLVEAPGDEAGPPPLDDPGMGGDAPALDDPGMGDMGGNDTGGMDMPPDMGEPPPLDDPGMGGDDMGMGDPNADMSEGEGQDLNQLLNLPEKVSAIMNLKLHERFLNLLSTISVQLQSIRNNADVLNALSKDSIDVVNHLKRLDENIRLYLKNNFINENYSKNLLFFNKCLNLLKLLNDAFDRDIHKGIREAE